jgi:hypothetical protein
MKSVLYSLLTGSLYGLFLLVIGLNYWQIPVVVLGGYVVHLILNYRWKQEVRRQLDELIATSQELEKAFEEMKKQWIAQDTRIN